MDTEGRGEIVDKAITEDNVKYCPRCGGNSHQLILDDPVYRVDNDGFIEVSGRLHFIRCCYCGYEQGFIREVS